MKLIFSSLAVLLSAVIIFAQTEYVETDNPVYRFLERMENEGIITDYNSFEAPNTRIEISSYLKTAIEHKNKISKTDIAILEDLETEFEKEIYGTTLRSRGIINGNDYEYLSDDQKYLFFSESGNFDIFINLAADLDYIHYNKKGFFNNNSWMGNLGGIIRGNINNKFGFYLKGTNGNVFGNKEAGLSLNRLAQNFKFTEKPDETFYDETEGYITADFDNIKFKLGRDRIKIGYGEVPLVNDNSPLFDYFSIKVDYNFFSYSFIHAKMLDVMMTQNGIEYPDKFFVYHRIGFNLSRHFDFGAGEFVLYGRRGIDISYLNPFAFFKSIEHANRDKDNTMLFFDINNNTLPGTKLYINLLLDDISYGKIGTGWWGNQVMLQAGFQSVNIASMPLDLFGSYRRTEPYVFTHKYSYNNFTNLGYPLSNALMPNSELVNAGINYRLNYRLEISAALTYIIHGANSGDKNTGGDINLGHRIGDSETVKFLEGTREFYRKFELSVIYEPVNQLFLVLSSVHNNNSLSSEKSQEEIQTLLTLKTVF